MGFVELSARLLEVLNRHRGKTLGLLLGFLISILLLTLGFFKTIFIVVCSGIGFYIGKRIDNHEDFREIIDRILPPHE